MKKNLIKLFTTAILAVVIFGCDTDDDSSQNEISVADIETIKSMVESGDWSITYYFDSDKDETSDYVGYVFNFGSDGVLSASNATTAASGAWSITSSDSSNDDSNDNDVDFNIVFNSPDLLEELSDDWDILKFSSTKIELIDISGGDGGTDYLTFEKM